MVPQQTMEPAPATLGTEMSMQEMTGSASMIVIGKCTGTSSQWVDRRLFTMATVSVKETLKGATDVQELTVALPGGFDTKGKFPVAMRYPGAPTFSIGEEAFLFLGPGEVSNSYSVMGFAAGKLSIAQDTAGNEVVTPDMTLAPVENGVGVTRGNHQVVRLSELKEQVKSYLK
jgi:hypothetical protein